MSDGKRFWGKPPRNEPDGSTAQNAIPARDVWVDVPLDVMQAATAARAEKFCELMRTLKFQDFNNHPFHHSDVALSPITNPSARVRKPWDYDFQG